MLPQPQKSRRPIWLAALLLPLAVAGCVTPAPTASVVRFHGANAPTSGTIHVVAGHVVAGETPTGNPAENPAAPTATGPTSLERETEATAIAAALAAHGFTPVGASAHPAYVATYFLTGLEHSGAPRRSGLTIGLGGGFGGRNVGMGGSVAVPVGQKRSGPIVRQTTLRLQIHQGSAGGPILWEGRASLEGEENSPAGRLETAVPLLAKALLSDYPGPTAQTTSVKITP